MLTVQYRMHAHIMGFSSEKFYGGQLVPHPSVRHAGLEAYDMCFAPDLPVEFIDTAGCGFLEVAIPESRSTANPEEARLLLERLAQLLVSYQGSNAACSLALEPDGVVASRRHSPSYDSSSRLASGLDGCAIKRHLSPDTTLEPYKPTEQDEHPQVRIHPPLKTPVVGPPGATHRGSKVQG